jgi:hypothetical protein
MCIKLLAFGLVMLYRTTGEPRYLRMAKEIEHDWERAGDYLRVGLDGREFFQSPRPRWQSLHATFADFGFWTRALSSEELHKLAAQ